MNLSHLSQIGVGLRPHHFSDWEGGRPDTGRPPNCLLEVLVDNYIYVEGGPALGHLDRIRADHPMVMHGVGMNVAGHMGLSREYLAEVKKLAERIQPLVVSDHLCYSRTPSHNSYDLLPFARTEANLKHIIDRVNGIQDALDRRFSLENVSSYVSFVSDEMTEIEFLKEICQATGSGILFDVNNIFVNGFNHGFDPAEELAKLDPDMVTQYHLAGHTVYSDYLHDTHDQLICDDVWALYRKTIEHIGERPTIVERDDDESRFEELMKERDQALAICRDLMGDREGTGDQR